MISCETSTNSRMELITTMKSNLHNVLFEPKSTKLWVANASTDGQPAANQKYFSFQLSELLKRKPDANSPQYPMPVAQEVSQKTK